MAASSRKDQVRNPALRPLLVWMRRHGPRRRLSIGASSSPASGGSVIDVGAGHGANFRHFPPAVRDVIAIEPETYPRKRAERNAQDAPVPSRVTDALADRLPFEDESVDAAVLCLVLGSVREQATVRCDPDRVLRRGGELRSKEHLIARSARLARLQRLLERSRIWPRLAGGCHSARDTTAGIEAAGFGLVRSGECRAHRARSSCRSRRTSSAWRDAHSRPLTAPRVGGYYAA